ncbi:Potassium voltage-gated channel subfamily H member 7 [Cichlidogyrus casuarinus]|uniref:Potassium voltage-gated channel subfamily H member 7 n=1 Tax=Cichlidogyrus casuarinus TaxID=1844966 RepID=A0ABD2Q185_9PLAT
MAEKKPTIKIPVINADDIEQASVTSEATKKVAKTSFRGISSSSSSKKHHGTANQTNNPSKKKSGDVGPLSGNDSVPLVANQLTAMIPLMSIQPHLNQMLGTNDTFRLVLSTQTEHNKSHVTEKFAQTAHDQSESATERAIFFELRGLVNVHRLLSRFGSPNQWCIIHLFCFSSSKQILSMDEDMNLEHRMQSTRMYRYILKHYSPVRAFWDWFILVLVLYTVIATPYSAVFGHSNASEDSATAMRGVLDAFKIIDIVVDIMFMLDIVINFRTTYVNRNDEVVSNPRKIACHYLKGWFVIDLFAAIPFDNILSPVKSEKTMVPQTALLKAVRLLRLVSVVRKLDRYSEYGWAILVLLTAFFALIAHWLACIWYWIGNYERSSLSSNRFADIGWLSSLANQTQQPYLSDDKHSGPDIYTKYITALYFTFSSLTSIGFGNVSPNTNMEKIFSIIIMLAGC